uniref:Uncharacterized protein n=1 Tax=Plectus sambesii TaxID=2011161 RepID=A0A914W7J3_9BILA
MRRTRRQRWQRHSGISCVGRHRVARTASRSVSLLLRSLATLAVRLRRVVNAAGQHRFACSVHFVRASFPIVPWRTDVLRSTSVGCAALGCVPQPPTPPSSDIQLRSLTAAVLGLLLSAAIATFFHRARPRSAEAAFCVRSCWTRRRADFVSTGFSLIYSPLGRQSASGSTPSLCSDLSTFFGQRHLPTRPFVDRWTGSTRVSPSGH